MEKIYLYFKDASVKNVKKAILQGELSFCEDKKQENKIKNRINQIVEDTFNDDNFKFTFCLTKEEALSPNVIQDIQKVIDNLTKAGCKKENIIFTVLDYSHNFETEEWDKIVSINKYLKKQKVKFGFEDHGKTWDIKKVYNANIQLQNSANELNDSNLSPLEKLMSAYFLVTSRVYIAESEKEHFAKSRSVYGILNSDKIVCVGYSEWLASIIGLTKDENIRVYQNGVQVSIDNKYIEAAHRNTIIYIKDKKYNLNGYYYLDATWDCSDSKNTVEFKLNNFMLPLTDIKEYYDFIRTDALFKYFPSEYDNLDDLGPLTKEEILHLHNRNSEYEYSSLLSDKHKAQFGTYDDNNNVSFSIDEYVYDGKFYNDFKKDMMHFNTLNDFAEADINRKLNALNDIIDRNKDIINNIDFIKDELRKHNITTLTSKNINDIAKTNNYVNTIIDIIVNRTNGDKNGYSVNTALNKLQTKLKEQQDVLEKYLNELMNENFSKTYNEENFKFFNMPILDETLNYLSTPIPLNKLKNALKEVLIKSYNHTEQEANFMITNILDNNIFNGYLFHKSSAQNAFAKACVEKYGDWKPEYIDEQEND